MSAARGNSSAPSLKRGNRQTLAHDEKDGKSIVIDGEITDKMLEFDPPKQK